MRATAIDVYKRQVLKDKDGKEIEVGSDTAVEAGDYTVVAKKGDDEVKLSDATISVDKGKSYTVAIKNHIFGTSAELSETGDSVPSVKLTWDAARMAYTTDKALASGKYTVLSLIHILTPCRTSAAMNAASSPPKSSPMRRIKRNRHLPAPWDINMK